MNRPATKVGRAVLSAPRLWKIVRNSGAVETPPATIKMR